MFAMLMVLSLIVYAAVFYQVDQTIYRRLAQDAYAADPERIA